MLPPKPPVRAAGDVVNLIQRPPLKSTSLHGSISCLGHNASIDIFLMMRPVHLSGTLVPGNGGAGCNAATASLSTNLTIKFSETKLRIHLGKLEVRNSFFEIQRMKLSSSQYLKKIELLAVTVPVSSCFRPRLSPA